VIQVPSTSRSTLQPDTVVIVTLPPLPPAAAAVAINGLTHERANVRLIHRERASATVIVPLGAGPVFAATV